MDDLQDDLHVDPSIATVEALSIINTAEFLELSDHSDSFQF